MRSTRTDGIQTEPLRALLRKVDSGAFMAPEERIRVFIELGKYQEAAFLPTTLFRWYESEELSRDVLRQLLPLAWKHCPFPTRFLDYRKWIELFRSTGFLTDEPGFVRPSVPFTIYRGSVDEFKRRPTWTTSLSVAVKHCGDARAYYRDRSAHVYIATAPPDAVLAMFFDKNDNWVVVDPDGLSDVRRISDAEAMRYWRGTEKETPLCDNSELESLSVEQLKLTGSGEHLGGAGRKFLYESPTGHIYLFKPAESKRTRVEEPFRAHIQVAVATLQRKVLGEAHSVPIRVVTLGGRVGTLQPLLQPISVLRRSSVHLLSPVQIRMLQREHIVDWAVANFDTSEDNFLVLDGGHIVGIDKEQAGRYIGDPGASKFSMNYNPNAHEGDRPPFYNWIYALHASGMLDLDPRNVFPAIQRLESIPDEEYRALFRDYAESLRGKGAGAERLLTQFVERKGLVRAQFERFIEELKGSLLQLVKGGTDEFRRRFSQLVKGGEQRW